MTSSRPLASHYALREGRGFSRSSEMQPPEDSGHSDFLLSEKDLPTLTVLRKVWTNQVFVLH